MIRATILITMMLTIALLGSNAKGRVISRSSNDLSNSLARISGNVQPPIIFKKSRKRSEKRDTAGAGLLGAVFPGNGQAANPAANIQDSLLGPNGIVGKLLAGAVPANGAQPAAQPASAGYYYLPPPPPAPEEP